MKHRRLLILFALATAGVAVLVWAFSSRVEGTTFRLTNGERVTFRAVTVGSNTTYCFGNVLQRVAAHIPGQLGDKLSGGTRAETWHYSDSNVVFWFLCEGGNRVWQRIRYRVVDEHGVESDPYFDINEAYSDGGTVGCYLHAEFCQRRSRTSGCASLRPTRGARLCQ